MFLKELHIFFAKHSVGKKNASTYLKKKKLYKAKLSIDGRAKL